MERWQNKVAVITGASSGIGAACAKALLEKGMIVVAIARRYERMENEIKQSLPKDLQNRYHPRRCDLTQETEIVATFKWVEETLGGADILINNAGIERETEIVAENNSADLRAVIEVNVLAMAFCTREAFRSMAKRHVDGHVFLLNSMSISPGHVYTEFFSDEYREIAKRDNAPFLNPEDVADAIVYCIQTPPHVQIHDLKIKPVGEMY